MSSTDPKPAPSLDRARRRATAREMAVIFAACVVLFWLGNARTGLWDRDEARYAQASAMMLHDGDWIVPKYFEYEPQYDRHRPRYHKPILIYWLQASAFAVLGKTEFAARLFSGLFAAGAVLCTYWLGLRMFSRRVGRLAAAMLATCLLVQVEGRLGKVDAPLLFFTTWSLACLWNVLEGRGSWANALCFWIALALGFLTKGPVIAVFAVPLVAVALWQWWPQRGRFWKLRPAVGAPLFLVLAAPWFVAVSHVTGGEYLRFAFGREVLGRAIGAMEGHYYFPGFYFVAWTLGLFPWAALLPASLIWWITKRGRDRRLMLLAVGGFLLPRLAQEFIKTQMFHYALPTYPAACVLMAAAVRAGFGHGKRLWGELEGKLSFVMLAAACTLGAVGLPLMLGIKGLTAALPAAVVVGLCTAGVGLVGCRHIVRGSFPRAGVWQMAIGATISCLVLTGWLIPSLEPYRLGRIAAETALRHAAPGDRIVLLGWYEDSTVFYAGREEPGRVWIAKQRDIDKHLSDGRIVRVEWNDPADWRSGKPVQQVVAARGRGLGQIVIVSPSLQSELVTELSKAKVLAPPGVAIPRAELLTPNGVRGVNFGEPAIKGSLIEPLFIYRLPPAVSVGAETQPAGPPEMP